MLNMENAALRPSHHNGKKDIGRSDECQSPDYANRKRSHSIPDVSKLPEPLHHLMSSWINHSVKSPIS